MTYIRILHTREDFSGLFLKFTEISQELFCNQFKNLEIYTQIWYYFVLEKTKEEERKEN